MAAQAVTAEELIGYLTDIVREYGDIPVITASRIADAAESVGRPIVMPVLPAGELDSFQAYKYTKRTTPSHVNAALIH